MKIIRTKFFNNQVLVLSKKYQNIIEDLNDFEKDFKGEPFSDLGNQIFKYRIKNSSIPTGKRGGFRMIIKIHGDKILPVLIYSKTIKENVTDNEIIHALEKIFQEL